MLHLNEKIATVDLDEVVHAETEALLGVDFYIKCHYATAKL